MMLEAELDTFSQLEVTTFAVQSPDDATVSAVDLVHATCISGGYHVVPIWILVNTVDMEVVPGIRAIVPGARLSWIDRKYSFVRGDMIQALPFE